MQRQIGNTSKPFVLEDSDNGTLLCLRHGPECKDVANVIWNRDDAWTHEHGDFPIPAYVEVLLFLNTDVVRVYFDDPDDNGFYKWDLDKTVLQGFKTPELHGFIKPNEGRRSIRQEVLSWLVSLGYSENRVCHSKLHGAVVPELERARVGATNKAFLLDTFMMLRWGKCAQCLALEANLIPEV